MADAAIVGLAIKDEKNLEAALRIGASFDEIRYNVARRLLRCVQDGLEEWARQQDNDWEVVTTWPGGNWVERPGQRWLPLSLRKRAWPAMVGVSIVAENPGPTQIFIGISGPTKNLWNSKNK